MSILHTTRKAAFPVILMGAALLGRPAPAAAAETEFACTQNQLTEIRAYIADTCDGGGSVWVYCSWMGLWEPTSAVNCY